MKRKYLAVGIILVFIVTCIIPSATSALTHGKRQTNGATIITVDDEPGDADFTSIKEAVNSSSPGDTIEVYSGNYTEHEIQIIKENIILCGISHELGEGGDTGKPFINGNGSGRVIRVEASHVIVSNFTIENSEPFTSACIGVNEQNNIIISDCNIRNSIENLNYGISVVDCDHIKIIHNNISNCNPGIGASTQHPESLTITGNVITDCGIYGGMSLRCNQQNISGNKIRRCEKGIRIKGTNNIIYGNDIDDCPIGFYSTVFERDGEERGNTIIKNNFKNYSQDSWWERGVIFYFFGLYITKKDRWIGNYWDAWVGVGPKLIRGWLGFGIVFVESGIGFAIPWFEFDWHPAEEPYEI